MLYEEQHISVKNMDPILVICMRHDSTIESPFNLKALLLYGAVVKHQALFDISLI